MRWKWIVIPLSFSLLVAVLAKPILSGSQGIAHTETGLVMSHNEPLVVTDDNLVDVLAALKLHLRIDKVILKGDTMAVDLKMNGEKAGLAVIYEDLAQLAALTVSGSANIEQLRFRLVAEDGWTGAKHLLLAADMKRAVLSPDFAETVEQLQQPGNAPLQPAVKERLGIIETALWKKSYPAASF